jgi:hypothetical protein
MYVKANEDNYVPSDSRKDSDEENMEENQALLRRNSIQCILLLKLLLINSLILRL